MKPEENPVQPKKSPVGQPREVTPDERQQERGGAGVVKKTPEHPEGEVVRGGAKPIEEQGIKDTSTL